jgi:hypothetical protein
MGEQDANYRFADEATIEPEHIARHARHALELGAAPISAGVGAQCAVIAAASQALNIVEIGTGAGVSGSGCCTARRARPSRRSTASPSTSARRVRRSRGEDPAGAARFITGRAPRCSPA